MAAAALFCAVSFSPVAMSQPPAVSASVDRGTVSVNQPFVLTVSIQGNVIGEPQFPKVDGIEFSGSSSGTSTSIQMLNGTVTRQTTRTWQVQARATRAGSFTIPAITATVDGKACASDPITVTVMDAPAQTMPAPPQPQQPSAQGRNAVQQPPQQPQGNGQLTLDQAFFVTSDVDKNRVYEGEELTLTLRIYRVMQAALQARANSNQLPLPTTEGFITGPVSDRTFTETKDKYQYSVQEFSLPLYPTGTGTLTVGPWNWEGQLYWNSAASLFPQSTFAQRSSQPIEVEVKPLPDRPKDFSGTVGKFTAKASLLKGTVVQGEPTKLQVRVRGRGNPDGVGAPVMPELPWAHVNDPESESGQVQPGGDDTVEKVFTFTITPTQAGDFEIPAFDYCYFAPAIGNYKREKLGPIPVHVTPSSESAEPVVAGGLVDQQKGAIEILGEDIITIASDAGVLQPRRSGALANAVALAFPPLLFGAYFLWIRRRRRFAQDTGYARDYFARSRGRKRLSEVQSAERPAEALRKAVTGFLADKLNCNEAGLTSQEARSLLDMRGVEAELVEAIVKVLRACERAEYSGVAVTGEELDALVRDADAAMDRLEAQLKRNRK